MNAVIDIETKDEQVEEKPLTGTIANKRAHAAALKRLDEIAATASKAYVEAANGKRDLFDRMMAVRVTITHNGRPDFGGNSDLWKKGVGERLAPIFEKAGLKTVEERRTFTNAVTTAGIRALIMEKWILAYVEKETTHKVGTPAHKKAVRAEYTAAKRNIPSNSPYALTEEEKEPKGGKGKGDPDVESPETILSNAITKLHTQDADYPVEVELSACLRMATEVAVKMQAMVKGRKNTIPNRAVVRMLCSDLEATFHALHRIAESKHGEEDLKTLALTAWTPVADK